MRRALVALALLAATPAAATTPVVLAAPGAAERTLTSDDLADLPASEAEVVFFTHAGPEAGDWRGVLLWRLVADAVPDDNRLGRVVVVTGRDGYQAAFGVGELDPRYGTEAALLATARDGAPLPADAGPRLIVPGDKAGGRAVRDVVRIEIR